MSLGASAEFGPQPSLRAPPKWKLLAGVYPDYFAGRYQYAWAEFLANRYDSALEAVQAATAPQEPLRNVAYELIGRIHLAQERYPAALAALKQAEAIGQFGPSRRHAAALAAVRRFGESEKILAALPAQSMASGGLTNQFERIAVPLDQGKWIEARRVAKHTATVASQSNPLLKHPFRLVDLLVRSLHDPARFPLDELEALALSAMRDAAQPDSADRDDLSVVALAAVRLSQRSGSSDVATRVLPRLAPFVTANANPAALKLLVVVQAEQLRLAGKRGKSIENLRELMDGSEPYQAHVALRDSLRAEGRDAEALRENRWLAAHRGRAYSDPAGGQVFQAMNVADTTLAHLDAAELLLRMGRKGEARLEAEAFRRAWPEKVLPDYLRRRLDATLPASKQNTTVWVPAEVR